MRRSNFATEAQRHREEFSSNSQCLCDSVAKIMLEFPEQKDPLTERIIGCAIEVHRVLGPGLLEASYEAALAIEFQDAKLHFQQQVIIPVFYKGRPIGDHRL